MKHENAPRRPSGDRAIACKTLHCMGGKEKQIVVRMTSSQHERLEAFQRRVCAPNLSAAARAAIELGMADADRDAGVVDDNGKVELTYREPGQ